MLCMIPESRYELSNAQGVANESLNIVLCRLGMSEALLCVLCVVTLDSRSVYMHSVHLI